MDLSRSPAEIANAAAEEVRALNHRTLRADAYSEPADISATMTTVQSVLNMLPQALRQTSGRLMAMEADERGIRIDSGADSAQAIGSVVRSLGLAQEHLSAAVDALARANGPLSSMGRPWPEAGDDEG